VPTPASKEYGKHQSFQINEECVPKFITNYIGIVEFVAIVLKLINDKAVKFGGIDHKIVVAERKVWKCRGSYFESLLSGSYKLLETGSGHCNHVFVWRWRGFFHSSVFECTKEGKKGEIDNIFFCVYNPRKRKKERKKKMYLLFCILIFLYIFSFNFEPTDIHMTHRIPRCP